jgi:hypothetical protein
MRSGIKAEYQSGQCSNADYKTVGKPFKGKIKQENGKYDI